MNQKIIKAKEDAKAVEEAAAELYEKLQTSRSNTKEVTRARVLVRKVQELQEDIFQLEMDSKIVDVVRAFDEVREKSTLTKKE